MGMTQRSQAGDFPPTQYHPVPCYRDSTTTESGREKRREWPWNRRSNFWSWACVACHLGTAYITSRYRPQHRSIATFSATNSTEQWTYGSVLEGGIWAHISWWPWLKNMFRTLRNPDPAVFLCASAAWGITTVFILERYRHHPYRYHFLVAGITISVLLAALTTTLEELPSYLAITYAPLWISVAMIFSITLHWLVLGHRK